MTPALPIDLESITDLETAKNAIERLLTLYLKQQEEIETLKAEIARLKGLPKKPQFGSSQKRAIGISNLLNKEKKTWTKSAKLGKLEIDVHASLPEVGVCNCGCNQFKTLRTNTKIIQGIIFKRNNVAYHGKDQQCLNCGKIYSAQIPPKIKGVSFDSSLKSFISFFKYFGRMTHPLIHRMLFGLGVIISKGEISEILLENGGKLNLPYYHLKEVGFEKVKFLQSDSTGSKRKEKQTGKIKNSYLQVISHPLLSVFSITKSYSQKSLEKLLTRIGRRKPFVSDDGSANGSLLILIKQLCWVHEIRHFVKLFPYFNPHKKEKEQILFQLKKFYHLAKEYGKDPTANRQKEVEYLFDELTNQHTEYDLLNKQLKTTKKKKKRLLTFLDYPFLPIHNNQCEQDLREFVIQRRISHETKSVAGDRSLERHLSIIQTAQKQGLNVFQTLNGLLLGTLSPDVLTVNLS